jgi:hypothetical protein
MLYGLHRVLIGAAIALGVLFAGYCLLTFRTTREPSLLLLAAISIAAGTAMSLYLRWFLRKRAQ